MPKQLEARRSAGMHAIKRDIERQSMCQCIGLLNIGTSELGVICFSWQCMSCAGQGASCISNTPAISRITLCRGNMTRNYNAYQDPVHEKMSAFLSGECLTIDA